MKDPFGTMDTGAGLRLTACTVDIPSADTPRDQCRWLRRHLDAVISSERILRPMSIQARLMALVLLALAPVIGAHAVSDILLYWEREREVRESALATAVIRNAELDGIVRGIQHLLGPASRLRTVASLDAEACHGALSALAQDFKYEDLVLVAASADGAVHCASTPNLGPIRLADTAFVGSIIYNREFTVRGFALSPVGGRKALAFGHPIFGEEGGIVGVVIAYLGLDWLAADLQRAPLPPGHKLILTDQNGVVLVHLPKTTEELVGRKLPAERLLSIGNTKPGIVELDDGPDGFAIYGSIPITVPPPGIFVLFGIDRAIAFGPIYKSALRSIALDLFSILAALLTAWLLGNRSVRQPVRQLLETIRLWRDGTYSARTHLRNKVPEIAELGVAFNRMAESIQSRDQQLAAANRAKDIVIATAGHDLRQPLQTITMALSTLSRQPRSEREQRSLDYANRAVDQLVRELDMLVGIARMHHGALKPQFGPVQLSSVLYDVAQQWSPRATEKGLRFRVRACSDVVLSDAKMLTTILQNFVGNAVKYTDRGGILICCRRRPTELWIEVYDTGKGIPPEMVGTIFSEFQQLDCRKEGFGLGVWIARSTADALGHKVTVKSTFGRGSRFRLAVPLGLLPHGSASIV
jgi:signal transduction histidine kinase